MKLTMKFLSVLFCALLLAFNCFAQHGMKQEDTDDPASVNTDTDDEDTVTTEVSPLIGYNFAGSKNSFATLNAEAYFGWNKPHVIKNDFKGIFEIGPYTATAIDAKDTENYLPAIMLNGTFGLTANYYFVITEWLYLNPANLGLKVLPGFGSDTKTIIAHNIRHSVSIKIAELLAVTAQYTRAWHNITSESEANYKSIFGKDHTELKYWTVTLQTKVSKEDAAAPLYFFGQWRGMKNASKFEGLQNSRILTFGVKSSISLQSANTNKYSFLNK